MRSKTNSKARPWVVVCSRTGSIPQVVGAFQTRQGAEGWIVRHRPKYPLWAFSTASLNGVPTMPVPWRAGESAQTAAPLRWWRRPFGRRRRGEREQVCEG